MTPKRAPDGSEVSLHMKVSLLTPWRLHSERPRVLKSGPKISPKALK
jgi:hypothetical protein